MPSQRFLLVEGVPGHPVSHPSTKLGNGSPARYIGMVLASCEHDEKAGGCKAHPDADHVLEHYQIAREVVVDGSEIRTAIKHRELVLLGEGVFKSFDAARESLHAQHGNAPDEARSAYPSTGA